MDQNIQKTKNIINENNGEMIIIVDKPNHNNELMKHKKSLFMNTALEADLIVVRAKGKTQKIITKV